MMLNRPVAIGGTVGAELMLSVDEQRVRLHRRLKRIVKARGYLDLQEAEALREAQKVQLWKEFGHTSLVDYMVNELGYSSWRTAEDRLRLANALPELPKLTEAIQAGELNMSQARELARVATPETEEKWIAKALDLNVRQVEQAVNGHTKGDLPEDPVDTRLVRKTMYLSVRPETEVLYREARKALEAERGEKLDDDAVLEALCRALLRAGGPRQSSIHVGGANADSSDVGGADAEVSTHVGGANADSSHVGGDDAEVSTHVGGADADVFTHVGAANADSSHVGGDDAEVSIHVGGANADSSHVGGDDAEVSTHAGGDGAVSSTYASTAAYRVAVTICGHCKRGWQHGAGAVVELSPAAVERATCDAQWIGNLGSTLVERARQEISPAMRRKVLHRDGNRCRVPGCQSHANLDIHHIIHRSHGGTNELSNLVALCEAHHLAHHDGTLLIVRDGENITFTRQASNRFTRTTREIATRAELRRGGFSREQVAAIMARTINIIGETDLTEEQWLTIAVRNASDHAS